MALLSQPEDRAGDLIKWESSPWFTRESLKLVEAKTTPEAVETSDVTGIAVKNVDVTAGTAELAEGGADEANIEGLVIQGPKIDIAGGGTTPDLYTVLVRGPAVLNEDELPANDAYGSAITAATRKTALEGLDMVLRSESDTVEEQTT